jgi:hypothetical protein
MSNQNKYPVTRPTWGSNPGLTDRLFVGRNVTLTLSWRWRQDITLKRRSPSTWLHGSTVSTIAAMKTWRRTDSFCEHLLCESYPTCEGNAGISQHTRRAVSIKRTRCSYKEAHHLEHWHCIVTFLWLAARWIDLKRSLSPVHNKRPGPVGGARCIVCEEDA